MSTNLEHQLEIQRVQTLFDQSSSAVIANLICGLGIYAVLPKNGTTAAWFAVLAATLAARGWLFKIFTRQPLETLEPRRWLTRYGVGIAVTGLLWGAVGVHATQTPPLGFAFFTVAVLVGLVGGSVATCAVSPAIFLAFAIPTLLPPSVALMLIGDGNLAAIGVLLIAYGAVILRSVRQIQGVITQSIRLRFENERLVEASEHERRRVERSEKEVRRAYDELAATHRALVEQRSLVDRERSFSERLRGLLPICASCKKIRDDGGEWNQLEDYLSARSEAQFSHGLCPDCLDDYASEVDD